MRYSTEPRYRKYVKGYSFLSFTRKCSDKYGRKLMDTATKTGIDAGKTTSKRVVQKADKLADKITSLDKPKEKRRKVEEIYIPPEKRHQIIDDLKLF